MVRSTHGVNCTGSCSWKVYVRTGSSPGRPSRPTIPAPAQTDPSTSRARLPARGGVLLVHLQPHTQCATRMSAACSSTCSGQPKRATAIRWSPGFDRPGRGAGAGATRGPGQGRTGSGELGRGREIAAGAHVYTVKRWGPDRIAGFCRSPRCHRCPIPPAPGSSSSSAPRCCRSTTGTPTFRTPRRRCSATRPTSRSPVTGGMPGYLFMWAPTSDDPHPDAHWMTEARYRGQKVVAVAPDHAENVKFADEWVNPPPAPTARWRWRWAT